METEYLLNTLADLQDALEVAHLEYEERKAILLSPMQAQLTALENEYNLHKAVFEARQEEARQQLIAEALRQQQTLKNDRVQVQFVSGRVTWDSKRLEGYAAAHPEVLDFRKVGEPSTRVVIK